MARFLQDSDYEALIKEEIRRLLDGRAFDGTGTPTKLVAAENMAVQQIKNRLSGRYDMDNEFGKAKTPVDLRDAFLIMITIDITLYHLYSQTGHKDIPKHRDDRYTDAIQWLKDVGTGVQAANFDTYPDDSPDIPNSDMRISSEEQENHKW
jgi:phage gp36-like protein